ncbi:MAG: hypothetical protein JXA13_05320 [Anaerolineales bacterium]|nr:hypothetical protein [Anaerolineales bacterium]
MLKLRMIFRRPKSEGVFYLLAFMLALFIRLSALGQLPLTDVEAKLALQSLGIAEGKQVLLDPPVSYLSLTGILFFIFGGTNFLARLLPALAGSALVFVPNLFREQIKPIPALFLAFVLALDPGMVAVSRQAGGDMLAILFLFLTWAMWQQRRTALTGICGALALMSGEMLWVGLVGLLLALVLQWALGTPCLGREVLDNEPVSGRVQVAMSRLRPVVAYGFGTLLVVGTTLFLSANGLSAWLNGLLDYFKGWAQIPEISIGRMLLALVVYAPLSVIFGVIEIFRGWWLGSRKVTLISLWAVMSLLLVFFYPGRRVVDLVWVIVPLWCLAVFQLTRQKEILAGERIETVGVVLLTVVVLVFVWLDLTSLNFVLFEQNELYMRLGLVGGALLLLAISILLVGLGWSEQIAVSGLIWGVFVALGIYTIGTAWGVTGLRTPGGVELFSAGSSSVAQADYLLQTVDDVSEWSVGHVDSQAVTIVGLESPSLEWVLRDYDIQSLDTVDSSVNSALVVAPAYMNELNLQASYRGQDFVWQKTPSWILMRWTDWLKWLTLRQMPQDDTYIVLWVRDDLFKNDIQIQSP